MSMGPCSSCPSQLLPARPVFLQLMLQQRTPITDRKFNGLYDSPMLDSKAPSIVKAVQVSTQQTGLAG